MNRDRVYRIQKQTYKKDFQVFCGNNILWAIDLKVNDVTVEETHNWTLNVSFINRSGYAYLTIAGGLTNDQFKYRYSNCFCQVDLFNNQGNQIWSCTGCMDGPRYDKFDFSDLCNVTIMQSKYNFGSTNSNILTLTVTFGSYDIIKPKSFVNQKEMLDSGILTDIVILTQGKKFHCHKVVLAAESEYFKAMFQAEMKESKQNVVNWVDVFDSATVQDLLHYFYTGETPPNIEETFQTLVEAAHLCLLEGLKDVCAYRMRHMIKVENAAYILQTAERFALDDLKTTAVNFVADNYEEALKTSGFKQLQPDVRARLFETVFSVLGKRIKSMVNERNSFS